MLQKFWVYGQLLKIFYADTIKKIVTLLGRKVTTKFFIFAVRQGFPGQFRHQLRHGGHVIETPCIFSAEKESVVGIAIGSAGQGSGNTVGNGGFVAFFEALVAV